MPNPTSPPSAGTPELPFAFDLIYDTLEREFGTERLDGFMLGFAYSLAQRVAALSSAPQGRGDVSEEDRARLIAVENMMASATDYGWCTPCHFTANFETMGEARAMTEYFAEARRRADERIAALRPAPSSEPETPQ